jgi:hypothetical protein
MKFLKRKSSLALVAMLVALLALPAFLNLNAKKVEASGQLQGQTSHLKNDVKPKTKHKPNRVGGAAPANDNCANAINVTNASLPYTNTQTTNGATDETGEPLSDCTDQFSSVWYTFTNTSATNRVVVSVALCNSNFDTALQVYKVNGAACDFANFAIVACNDDSDCGDGLQSQASFTADPGATYKIQAGGFEGDTGSLGISITGAELSCADIVVNGTLGSGSPDYPGTSGQQTPARLFRDGIPSTCAVPKTCPGPFGSGSFTYDAYTFANQSGESQCVTINYNPNTAGANPVGVNAHAIAYLNSFSNTDLCANYLGDVGSSDELPFSVTVPAGASFVIVIAANNPAGVGNGGTYQFTVVGNICAGFDFCVQQDAPKRFLEVNSTTGAYRYTDCSKNIIRTGTGSAFEYFCKVDYSGSGTTSSASALFNPCTKKGDATIQVKIGNLTQTVKISDKDITNNDCQCTPTPQ